MTRDIVSVWSELRQCTTARLRVRPARSLRLVRFVSKWHRADYATQSVAAGRNPLRAAIIPHRTSRPQSLHDYIAAAHS